MFDIVGWCSKHHLVIAGCDEPARPFGVFDSACTASRMMSKYVGIVGERSKTFGGRARRRALERQQRKAELAAELAGTPAAPSSRRAAGDARRPSTLRATRRPRDRSRCHHGLARHRSREFVPPARAPLAPKSETRTSKRTALGSGNSLQIARVAAAAEICAANRTRRARRPRIPVAPNRTAPTPPTHHCQNVSLLACNVSCARCGASPRPGGVGVDLNCCHGGGAWEGLCGGAGGYFSYRQGYRACNLARILRAGRQRPPRRAAAANRSPTRPRDARVMTFDRRQLIL